MQERNLFEYAVIRIVPRVEREEFINVGVVLFCRDQKFLRALFEINEERILTFAPKLDMPQMCEYLRVFQQISAGDRAAAPMSLLPIAERFRWLTAARSTMLQTSRVHSGLCTDAEETLEKLHRELVLTSV